MRHPNHVKETVASRRFERVVSSAITLQKTDQGNDYGIDYVAALYDENGEPAGRFNVQLKYLNESDIQRVAGFSGDGTLQQRFFVIENAGLLVARRALSLKHVRAYLNSSYTTDPTLYVLANETNLFTFWVNDVFDYYLRWMPLSDQQTLSWWASNIQLSRRFVDGKRSPYLIPEDLNDGELAAWCKPKTLESLTNLALSIYLKHAQSRTYSLEYFDCDGFWALLQEDDPERGARIFAFGAFLGLLRPTVSMSKWAKGVVEAFDTQLLLPPAVQVLGADEDPESRDFVMGLLRGKAVSMAWLREFDKIDDRDDWARLTFDYMNAIGDFLVRNIKREHEESQAILIELFVHFDYSVKLPNIFGQRLRSLAMQDALLQGPSLTTLCDCIHPTSLTDGERISDAVEQWDGAEREDYRNSK